MAFQESDMEFLVEETQKSFKDKSLLCLLMTDYSNDLDIAMFVCFFIVRTRTRWSGFPTEVLKETSQRLL